jgi:hypothetical protein
MMGASVLVSFVCADDGEASHSVRLSTVRSAVDRRAATVDGRGPNHHPLPLQIEPTPDRRYLFVAVNSTARSLRGRA